MSKDMSSKDLVKIIDSERSMEIQKVGQLKQVLNSDVPKAWLKHNDFSKTEYLPIDKVEDLLDMIFQEWKVEVLSLTQLAQSVTCVVRVHYRNPVTSEWSFHDGVGAVDIQTKKGASAADMSNVVAGAIQRGAPAAKSYAIKDAAEHIGKIFGRDINRKDTMDFHDLYMQASEEEEQMAQLGAMKADLAKKYGEYAKCDIVESWAWVNKLNKTAVERWLVDWEKGERPYIQKKSFRKAVEEGIGK